MKVLILNGPNLNMTGKREPQIYGSETLDDINARIAEYAKSKKCETEFFQSNCEGEIVGAIQRFGGDAIIINAGAYTHYSYAISDALKMKTCKKIEVHMSNVFSREEFRHKSVLSPVVDGVICGFGKNSYILALDAALFK